MFRLLLAMLLLPATAFALDPAENVLDSNIYPTTQQLYEDCKKALSLADKGDHHAFMRNECGLFMQGVGYGSILFHLQIPPDAPEESNVKEIYLCNQNEIDAADDLSIKTELISMGFAKKFIGAYENRRDISNHPDNSQEQKELQNSIDKMGVLGSVFTSAGYLIHDDTCN